jgi:hypothetical protein
VETADPAATEARGVEMEMKEFRIKVQVTHTQKENIRPQQFLS